MKKKTDQIPNVIVYGNDDLIWSGPELIHVEAMCARAKLLTGNVKPHAHQELFQLVFALSGECNVQLDGASQRVEGPCIVSIPAGVVHAFMFEEESAGWVVTASSHLVVNLKRTDDAQLLAAFLKAPFILPLDEERDGVNVLTTIFTLMMDEFEGVKLARNVGLEALLRLLLIHVRRRLEQEETAFSETDENRNIFHEFRSLVEKHYRDQWAVSKYAGKLCCSQPRLNRICARFAERTANEIIMDRIVLEACRRLLYTTAPAIDIAYDLGFQDPSYFSRFFKRRLGVTPRDYRARA